MAFRKFFRNSKPNNPDQIIDSKLKSKKNKSKYNLRYNGLLRTFMIPLTIIVVRDIVNEKGIIRKTLRLFKR
ncbi:MAG TPA: hypothetical protein VKO63_09965 [Chitinispirillaceae bacterium]|nr:hypothetical protein [Chitinispirillaceae bacterium]